MKFSTRFSHADHGLLPIHMTWIFEQFGDRQSFFTETVTMDARLPSIPCALHGPLMGDFPIPKGEKTWLCRGDRPYLSAITWRRPRPSRLLTVIGGPYEGNVILFTAYGGPLAAREEGDPSLTPAQSAEAAAFWAEHALSGTSEMMDELTFPGGDAVEDEALAEVRSLLASAIPRRSEHPTMWDAWRRAEAFLRRRRMQLLSEGAERGLASIERREAIGISEVLSCG